MSNIPQAWQVIDRPDGAVEILVKQVRDRKSVVTAACLILAWLLAALHLLWSGVTFSPGLLLGNGIAALGFCCFVISLFATGNVFYGCRWVAASNSLLIREAFFGIQRERCYQNGHFEFETQELESNYWWALKVCTAEGEQILFSSPIVAALHDAAHLLTQKTGWPVVE